MQFANVINIMTDIQILHSNMSNFPDFSYFSVIDASDDATYLFLTLTSYSFSRIWCQMKPDPNSAIVSVSRHENTILEFCVSTKISIRDPSSGFSKMRKESYFNKLGSRVICWTSISCFVIKLNLILISCCYIKITSKKY